MTLHIEFHYGKCRYAECRDFLNSMLGVVMLNVIILSVVMLNFVMLGVATPPEEQSYV